MSRKEYEGMLPSGFPFLNQASFGGGIPVASHTKVMGLPIVSFIHSCSGPSICGGTTN